ncbi:MAG TPA: PASTA domain-containing protein [Gaiellaceae bacterium]|nr:PASTA domain-containing protein [Gaiellaceae bacterium]
MPRLAVVGAVLLLASATLAVGAAKRMAAVPQGAPAPVPVATVVVPDVTGQAFVFAKGTLEDTGLAWKVTGNVHGYAANKVSRQVPAAGTKLKDTGAPTITVTLERTAYPEQGEPEDVSPYFGTSVQPIGLPKTTPAPTPAPVAPTPAAPKPVAAKPKPAAPAPAAKRAPDFVVAGAPREPQKEMPLPQRARLLSSWIASHAKTRANMKHFLYQHSWIVTGAKFGWWHGAEALRELIAADRAAHQRWGVGRKSELVARAALAAVEARSK